MLSTLCLSCSIFLSLSLSLQSPCHSFFCTAIRLFLPLLLSLSLLCLYSRGRSFVFTSLPLPHSLSSFLYRTTSHVIYMYIYIYIRFQRSSTWGTASGNCKSLMITCNLNMIKHDYSCNLRHKTLHLCACYHTLSAFLSFYAYLCHNLKIH